nr:hypothetical protein [uncultured Cellulosilyticum sp.]
MKDAIRNVRDLLIDPYRAFMRMEGVATFNVVQYIIYMMSVLALEGDRKGFEIILDMVCIGGSSFLVGWIYKGVIRACGGDLNYWRSLNAQVCMGTFANIGDLFEIGQALKVGSAISLAVNIYCVYLHLRCVIVLGGAPVKRTMIVYAAIFVAMIAIIYIGFGILSGTIISERGYIG